jgi:methionyl-tRNA formyltransferase
MKIIFFGTPDFSAKALDYLLENHVEVAAVVSKPDRPKGRSLHLEPTPVKQLIQTKYPGIPLFQPEKVSDPAFAPTLAAFEADLFVVVAYGEIIKSHLLEMPKTACINLHTSLLPALRGAAPIQRAIINGDKVSGVTIMHMSKKMDAGDIIHQSKVDIPPEMTFGELENELLEVGKKDLLDAILKIETSARTIQNHDLATLAPKVELEECEIKWERPASELHNLVRGVNPEPGAWVWVHIKGEKKRLKVFKTRVSPLFGLPGAILKYGNDGFVIGTGENALELIEIQLEGKKRMLSADLMRGISRDHWFL